MKTLTFMALVSVLACSACVVEHDDGPPPNGTLVVDWTISGTTDDAKCTQNGADSIQVTVNDADGTDIGTFAQSCEAFAESIPLAPGDYSASAVLVDSNGKALTTAVPINTFRIYGADELDIPIDFPADSFF
jgi:hypothetical protein